MGKDVSYGSLIFSGCVVGVIVTVLYSIYCALFVKKPKDKKGGKSAGSESAKQSKKKSVYPIYFTVKQDPRYIFAEYQDRYELYLKTDNGLQYVRTDNKQ